MEKYKKITLRGTLSEGNTIEWYDFTTKILQEDTKDFLFWIVGDDSFFERYKYIQDNNNLASLRIDKIEELEANYEFLH